MSLLARSLYFNGIQSVAAADADARCGLSIRESSLFLMALSFPPHRINKNNLDETEKMSLSQYKKLRS